MTPTPLPIKAFLIVCGSLVFVFLGIFAQTPQPSPSATPESSPSPSPSASPSPRAPTPTPLPGAQNFHQWGSVTVFNGLPSDSVRAIAQTPDGVMWFGTDNGLARFDGRRVQNLSPGGPETNNVLALATSANGELWIGTRAGAFVYASGKFQPVGGTTEHGVTRILIDEDTAPGRDVFLGTDSGLVLRAVRDEAGILPAVPLFVEPIRTSDGAVVGITGLTRRAGTLTFSTSGRGLFEIGATAEESDIRAISPVINTIARKWDDRIWLGTGATKGASGVFAADGSGPPVRIKAPTADVYALEINNSGVWAGTERYGLFHFIDDKLKKNYTFENTSGGLRSNTVFTLFTDREGVIWIGTNRGVSRFDTEGALQESVSDIPNSNFVRTIFPPGDSQTQYAGTNRGLFRKDIGKEGWNRVEAFRDRVVHTMNSYGDGVTDIIVGTASGLFDLSGRLIVEGDTRGLSEFQGRMYAAVFGRGVFDVTGRTPRLVVPNGAVTTVLGAPDRLWIGTNGNGLYSFDGKNSKLELAPDLLKSGAIWKIHDGAESGSLWIAGQHGVFRIRNGTPELILEVEDVRDIWDNRDDFWAATTTRGLIHARRDERFGWISTSIGFEQGLPSEKAFAIVPIEAGFLVGTNRGIVMYAPGEVEPKLIPVRILSQRVHDLSEISSAIALDYPQNTLLIEVAGQSSRTFPEEFQYAFVLKNEKGDELDRRISNDPQYGPSDLGPGSYSIEAVAFDRDLKASEPLTISFSVAKAPFPWTATALGVLLVLALVGLAWAIYEHRRIVIRNRELAAARLDLANEAERERRRIARDLHDQTLADLRNLMITSDKLEGDNREFRAEIEAVSTEIRRICEDLSPSVLENVGLVAALEFLLSRTVENHEFSAEAAVEDRIGFPLNVQLQIYRIAQEVLTNIQRHSDADLVEMNVEASQNGEFVLTIRDNGTAFQPDGAATGRGISNIRARANLINGKVGWKESRRGGNVFTLKLGE
jgi:signal transduction histidine kinase/ligand-binding sensor domain-containing protein